MHEHWMPHLHCYFRDPFVYWSSVLGDAATALSYLVIAVVSLYVSHSSRHLGGVKEARLIGKQFTLFVGLCGLTHGWKVVTTHEPLYRVEAVLTIATATASVWTAATLWRNYRRLQRAVVLKTPEESDLLTALTEGTTDGFWDWDIASGRDQLSPRYLASLGFKPGELEHHVDSWKELLHPEDRERAWAAIQAHLQHGTPYAEVVRIRDANGDYRWRLDRGIALRDETGVAYRMVGTHMDVSHIKHTEEQLRRTNSDLEQFAYSASHDLQEPLRQIAGFITALFEDYGDRLTEPDAEEAKAFVIEGVQRMRRLINDLLRFSRAGRNLKMARFPLVYAVNEVISSLALAIEEADAIIQAENLPEVYADHTMLSQVLQNLVANSLKYRAEGRPCVIQITATTKATEIVVHVADNGIGIPEKYREQVFEVFTRLYARGKYNGTGIGLALVRRIVHAHGGQVGISSSEEGQGTTVSFSLPLEEFSVAAKEEEDA